MKKKKTPPKTSTAPPAETPDLTPEDLVQIAERGDRKLTADERRRVMAWLDGDRYGTVGKSYQTNAQLARLFGVSEVLVHQDRRKMLRDYAATLTPEEAMTLVARYFQGHDRLLAAAEKGLNEAPPGTMAHREYLKLYSDLAARQIKLAQDIGILRKELGHLQVTEETWVAETSPEGITSVSRLDGARDEAQPT